MFATLADVALAAPVSFAAGCVVGFLATNRWRIVRRNGNGHDYAETVTVTRDYSHDRGAQ